MSLENHDDEKVNLIKNDHLLHIHLNEYRKLKDEQIARIIMREHMIYVTLATIGAVSSYALHSEQHYAFLVIPWVCIVLGWLYITTDEKVSAIGEYLRHNLADKLDKLTNSSTSNALGWEVVHRSDKFRVHRKVTQLIVDQLTFVGSGLFALAAFWWMQKTEWHSLFKITWGIELMLLIWLGISIFITTDMKKGR